MRPLQIREEGDILLMKIVDSAALNEGQALGLRQAFGSAIEGDGPPLVAMDLSAIDYISSTGIAFLIGSKRRIEARQGHLVLFGLLPDVLEIFAVMKLVNIFEIADDEARAVGLLPPSPSR